MRLLISVLVGSTLSAACDSGRRATPQGYLFEKGAYQGFYGPSGRLIRLLYDENGDKKADVVMLFHANGRVSQAEVDTNKDGVVDRWQYYSERAGLEKEGYSRRNHGKPDVWQYNDKAGNVIRRELDDDGDGRIDRTENFRDGRLISIGIDGDSDGRIERWQTWVDGRVTREELDLDADGIPDRRLRYSARGNVAGVDTLSAPRAPQLSDTAR